MLEGAIPLFLIGCPRSGTTFAAKLLNSHPHIIMTNETAVLMLLDDVIKKAEVGIEAGVLYGKEYNLLLAALLSDSYGSLIRSFYEQIAWTEGKHEVRYWGEKHPHISMCLDRVDRSFPTARFIYMVRDPRDAACSIAEMQQSSFAEALVSWKLFSDTYEAFADRCTASRLLLVRYENLVLDYERETARILDWLNLEITPEVVNFLTTSKNVDAHSLTRVRNFALEAIGRWVTRISETDRSLVQQVLGNYLAFYDYGNGSVVRYKPVRSRHEGRE
jgi:hypothetical protein